MRRAMTRLEGTRRDPHGLDESKAITSEVYVPLASEPIGRWPTGRSRLVLYIGFLVEFSYRLKLSPLRLVAWFSNPLSFFAFYLMYSMRLYPLKPCFHLIYWT
jgi:hypothetical protein